MRISAWNVEHASRTVRPLPSFSWSKRNQYHNADRILTSVKMLEINVSDVIEI